MRKWNLIETVCHHSINAYAGTETSAQIWEPQAYKNHHNTYHISYPNNINIFSHIYTWNFYGCYTYCESTPKGGLIMGTISLLAL